MGKGKREGQRIKSLINKIFSSKLEEGGKRIEARRHIHMYAYCTTRPNVHMYIYTCTVQYTCIRILSVHKQLYCSASQNM